MPMRCRKKRTAVSYYNANTQLIEVVKIPNSHRLIGIIGRAKPQVGGTSITIPYVYVFP